MEAYIVDWLGLLVRWLHFVAGVAWVGASFYFVWLDNHLEPPQSGRDRDEGVAGEVWSVHGGGFYHARKFALTPPQMPATLHWFKWEAYTTWLSGMALLALVYWYGAEVYLIDPGVAELGHATAVAIGIATLVAGWVVYDLLCKSPLGRSDTLLGIVVFLFVSAAAWGLCQVFSGRGAFIHYGAMLGTIMVANVAHVIIPGQRELVAAASEGRRPDPVWGLRGKQRSVHNTYFTLPVLFVMISNHYAMTYSHPYNWLILIALSLAGALVRVYFVARHRGRASPVPLVIAALIVAALAWALAPSSPTVGEDVEADISQVETIIGQRCASCHARNPTQPGFAAPPNGFVLENRDQILANADSIYQQAVASRAMPIGNLTGMTDKERRILAKWYESQAQSE
ncbi:MAG TPA: urate hydroxylase PuuD [Arenicellales bacterium]|nr:urate hydroxylase PuuD [Arenicellales bacterium]